MIKYLRGSLIFTGIAIIIAGYLGYVHAGIVGLLDYVFIVSVLAVLETSLSFDNAVVNAKILKTMDPVWQKRFLTWGILIAVFGMRIVFPLLIVGIAGSMLPLEALSLALQNPEEYERILMSVHAEIAAFGGTFLLMVGLRYFFDHEKDVHWIKRIEEPLVKSGKLYMVESALMLTILAVCAHYLPEEHQFSFLIAGIAGLVVYAMVQWTETILEMWTASRGAALTAAQAGLASFIYLEVLDASFSFDGVIGAFALSNNIIIIALGLGIGAFFVRSMTIMLVEKGTLNQYVYLEHGAFWAILALGVLMFAGLFVHIPEVIIGLIGALLIGLSVWSSIRTQK